MKCNPLTSILFLFMVIKTWRKLAKILEARRGMQRFPLKATMLLETLKLDPGKSTTLKLEIGEQDDKMNERHRTPLTSWTDRINFTNYTKELANTFLTNDKSLTNENTDILSMNFESNILSAPKSFQKLPIYKMEKSQIFMFDMSHNLEFLPNTID